MQDECSKKYYPYLEYKVRLLPKFNFFVLLMKKYNYKLLGLYLENDND